MSNQTNKHATVRTRTDRRGQLRTETSGRDAGFDVAISTDTRNNSTRVYIDEFGRTDRSFGPFGADMVLNGRQARTLYRALHQHFTAQDKQLG